MLRQEVTRMQIKEVMERTGLSRKALEYYQEKGLVAPRTLENGYRDYSEEQADALRQVALLRALDVPLEQIRAVLEGRESLPGLARAREAQQEREARRARLLRDYAEGGSVEALRAKAEALLREESLARRFERLLPGYFGWMLMANFAPYLQEPALSAEQEQAFADAAAFLDSLPPFHLPEELMHAVEEAAEGIDADMMKKAQNAKEAALRDAEGWLEENSGLIKEYQALKQSEEYQALPVVQAGERLKDYLSETGFYQRFIPLLRRLSPAYDAYYQALIRADAVFRERVEG